MTTREEQLLERLREATVALRRTLDERDALIRGLREPIAIVGIGCRFPGGADDPAAYWELLAAGRDAVAPLADRWALAGASPVEAAAPWAGLLTGAIDEFDAGFFGVAPREAVSLDPQQRLLLEVAWEALEDAGVPAHGLLGGRGGVFIGATNTDYRDLLARLPRGELDVYTVTGNLLSVAAGRLAYTLGLQGPCMTVDTVCSSSLVVVHLACASLRAGECDLALAGGVNLVLSPETMDGMARTQALSPEGRCKTFDALADGFVRGEGCGLVVLKRLSDAVLGGDRIWGLVRGSAVNQDGRSTGLTAPNVLAQEALLREALRAARATAADIGFVETHGTGTSLGDPIEVEALRAVLGEPRADGGRCVLGAVKTNLGHLEAAAGIAGLIKAVLALHHGRIPRNLNLRTVNPRLRLEGSALTLATEEVAWPRGPRPRLAGVSSFGLSGTNAHVIVEEAPAATEAAAAPERACWPVVLSGKTAAALAAQAGRLAEFVGARPGLGLGELAFSLATTRSPLEHRLAIAARSRGELLAGLAAAAGGGDVPANMSRGTAGAGRGKLALLFTGQGAQVVGMGRGLHAAWPAFRAAFDRCAGLFDAVLARPLRAVMWAAADGPEAGLIDRTEFAQPALFALEYALAALWRSWGAEPGLLAGHSVGELVAACVAEVFSLEDAVRLVAARGRLMQGLPAGGVMVAIAATEAEVAAACVPYAARLAIAAVNGPDQVVISGAAAEVAAVAEGFAAQGRRTRALAVSHAFHSPLIEPMLAEFARVAGSVTYRAASVPVVSNVTGALAGPELATAGYGVGHARATVRFADGVRALHAAGATCFIEVGPRPALLAAVPGILAGAGPTLLASLRGGGDEATSVCEALAGWWASGGAVRWPGVFPEGGRRVALPSYAWQRQRCWPTLRPAVVAEFYDALTRTDALAGRREEGVFAEKYLTFAPFAEVVPGFSWMVATATPVAPAEHVERVLTAQREMRAVLFGGVDFAGCREVLDFGCGYATDLIALARRHPHLELHGCTISGEQARHGEQRARDAQVGDRVKIFHADSAREPFAGMYDAIFGVEVACHIRDKQGLLANVGGHLRAGGTLVLADFVSMASFDIDHEEALSFLATGERWVAALTGGGLRLVGCVDVSPQIANFLHDPDFAANLEVVARHGGDPGLRASFKSYDQLSKLLQRGMVRYVLMTARRDAGASAAALERANRAALAAMVGYPEAVAALAGEADERLFATAWESTSAPAGRIREGRWALLGDGGLADPLADALRSGGHRVAAIANEADAAGLRGRLMAAFDGQAPTAVVHLGGLVGGEVTAEGLAAALAGGVDVALAAVQALSGAGWRDTPRLWLVTRGAQAVGEGGVDPLQAPLLGLGRVAAIEHPELRCGRIDLDPARPGDAILALRTELLADDVEDEVAWRGGSRLVARVVRRSPAGGRRSPAELLRADGSYVITGGLGGLGLGVAGWLAAHGAGHLVLVGRSGVTSAEQRAAVAAIEGAGARVTVARADVADREQVARVLRDVEASGIPLRGVVHAAGVADPGMLRTLTPARFRTVMAAKVLGAVHLHELTQAAPLDLFVMYASVAGLLGLAGTGNYAAANAFLGALAEHRQARGLAGLSVDWGLFTDVGLAARPDGRDAERFAQGLRGMTPEAGLAALGRLLDTGGQVAVALFDARQWVDAYPAAATSPRWSRLLRAEAVRGGEGEGLRGRLAGLGPEARARQIAEVVRAQVAHVLRLAAPDVPEDAPLTSLGMDSLMGLEVRNRIEVAFAIKVPSTLLWTYPTVAALGGYLAEMLGPAAVEVAEVEVADAAMSSDESARLIDAEFDALD